MHFIPYFYYIVFNTFFYLICDAVNNDETEDLSANDIAETLIRVFGADLESSRITELKDKLKKIDSYVIDKNKYTELLKNITTETDLNQTNFFTALYKRDNFNFLFNNNTKNLYLKLKQNINRDDIVKILSEKGNTSNLFKSARKAIGIDYLNRGGDDSESDTMFDTIVDEFIAESPKDKHKHDLKDNENIYWDPQGELEDLKEYHQHDGRRIFKGERTIIKNYPFMVSVHVMGRFWCGGSLYWHDLVLTSAACLQLMHNNRFFRENPNVLKVRIGSNHSRIGGEMVDALEVYFHPSYNPRTLQNNIAVIRLRYHLFFSYHRTPKIIAISHSPGSIPDTAEVLLLGWGVKKHDAGGPAIVAGKLVGIISFGPSICGFPNAPTVFTLVGAFADWIEKIKETMPSYYIGKKGTTTRIPYGEYQQTQQQQRSQFYTRFTSSAGMNGVVTTSATLDQPTLTTETGALRSKKSKFVDFTSGDDTSSE
ncbi:unnamed protein product [Parnassius apollo]|uniref:(apollo) hypothetical protein n=1 Tax=Parnassius apollo TaxID=110799 RepID=A0A8S3WD17_PARAO|nr:unnamed protein product [Parnassius apollo]